MYAHFPCMVGFFFFFIFTPRWENRVVVPSSWPWNEYCFKPWPFIGGWSVISLFFFPPSQLDDCAYCFPFLHLSILRLRSFFRAEFRASFRSRLFSFLLLLYTDFNFLRKGKKKMVSFIHEMILFIVREANMCKLNFINRISQFVTKVLQSNYHCMISLNINN